MKKLLNKIFFASIMFTPVFAFAASPFLKPVKDLLGDLEIFIQFLNWALPAVGILFFFLAIIVYVALKAGYHIPGFHMGDKETGAGAGFNIVYAIFALAAMFAVYGLIQLIGALFGVDTNRSKTITAPSLPQVGGVRGGQFYQ